MDEDTADYRVLVFDENIGSAYTVDDAAVFYAEDQEVLLFIDTKSPVPEEGEQTP